ncbi:MAG TPA: DUF4249 domain-containing protein [Chryseosolibacter sp.]
MRLLRLLPIVFVTLDACVERLELPVAEGKPRLLVDGLLTNNLGTHSVKLSTTTSLEKPLGEATPITNASVHLIDNHGNTFPLVHSKEGVYSITNFQGQTGTHYKLQFRTAEGKEYESTLQALQPAGDISAITYELVENAINKNDLAAPHDVFRFYIDAKNSAGSPGLFRWRWTAVYEVLTFPELRTKPVPGIPPSRAPDPMQCSGWVANGMTMHQVRPCECCTCWVTEYSRTSLVSNNQFALKPEFNHVQIAQVPIDWKKFQAKYFIKIEQLNLSDEVYEFWKNVAAQQSGTRNLFQPNVIRMRGNITCLSDPDEEVAGIFSVAGSTTSEIFINRRQVPKALQTDTVINDCRLAYPGSTTEKPTFW